MNEFLASFANRKHGARRHADDLLGGAAEDHALHPGAAVRPDDDQPGPALPGFADDLPIGNAGGHAGLHSREPVEVGLEERIHPLEGVLFHPPPEQLERDLAPEHRVERRGFVEDVKDDQAGSEALGKLARRAGRLGGTPGKIGRQQDRSEHGHPRKGNAPAGYRFGRGAKSIGDATAVSGGGAPYFFFPPTASLSPLPALNLGTLAALILIASPVWGLRPVRAFRLLTLNVPKPVNLSFSPFFKLLVTAPRNAATASSACPFPIPASARTASTSSAFVICRTSSSYYDVPENREKRRWSAMEVVFINPERRPRVKG